MSEQRPDASLIELAALPAMHVFLRDEGMDTYVIDQWRDWVKYKLGEDSSKLETVDRIFGFAKLGVRRKGRMAKATVAEVSGLLRKLADQMSPE